MRIFVASASHHLTDHDGHGEGLIAWNFLSRLAARGHEIVACTARAAMTSQPPFDVVELTPRGRRESLHPLEYARRVDRVFRAGHSVRPFDVVWWMLPVSERDVIWSPRARVPFALGPVFAPWPDIGDRSPLPASARTLVLKALNGRYRQRHRRALRRVDLTLESLPGVGERYSRRGGRVAVVAVGTDVPNTDGVSSEPDSPTIVFVGSLEQRKGVLELIDAYCRLADSQADLRLVIAGTGSLESEVRARLGSSSASARVELRGAVPADTVVDVFAGGTIACLPSHGEPFGLVLCEAMAAGRPVVSTSMGGPLHLVAVPEGGRLVEAGDADALAEALLEVLSLDRREREAMGAFNRARVDADLRWDRCVDLAEAALERARSPETPPLP